MLHKSRFFSLFPLKIGQLRNEPLPSVSALCSGSFVYTVKGNLKVKTPQGEDTCKCNSLSLRLLFNTTRWEKQGKGENVNVFFPPKYWKGRRETLPTKVGLMPGSFLKRWSLVRDLFEVVVEFCVYWGEIPGGGDSKCKGPVGEIDMRDVCEASMAGVEGKRK